MKVNVLVVAAGCVPRRHARSLRRAAARGLHQAGLRGAGPEGRRDPQGPGARAAEARRAAGRSRSKKRWSPANPEIDISDEDRERSAGAVARPEAAGPHPRRLRHAAASWARRPISSSAIWPRCRGIWKRRWPWWCSRSTGRRQNLAHGRGAGVRAGRRAHPVLGDDGAVAVLHGRDGSEAQGAGRRRGRGRQPRGLRAEAAAERRRAVDRVHRQGPGHRASWSRISTASKAR